MLKYFIAPFCVWVISQTLKFLNRIFIKKEPLSLKHAMWIYVYGDGAPSTHSALLVSGLWVVGFQYGIGPLFYFALAVAMILIYNLAEDRKRQKILESHLRESADPALRGIITEGKMLDMSGHDLKEILWGIALGVVLGVAFNRIP